MFIDMLIVVAFLRAHGKNAVLTCASTRLVSAYAYHTLQVFQRHMHVNSSATNTTYVRVFAECCACAVEVKVSVG